MSHSYTTGFFLFFFFLMIRRPPRSTLLSLHDALPICHQRVQQVAAIARIQAVGGRGDALGAEAMTRVRAKRARDRKSTRLNSSHQIISYAVFCLKKKKKARRGTQGGAPLRRTP